MRSRETSTSSGRQKKESCFSISFSKMSYFCWSKRSVNVARFDQQKYDIFEKLIEKQLSFFWRPEEVDVFVL
jgi:ribonucleotide reductase beta subunit family protein with ferritin-like domain